MADETAKRDKNYVPSMLGLASDDQTKTQAPYIDPATGRLLVTAVVTAGATTATEYTEGDTDATLTGIMLMGEGPADTVTPFAVDAAGKLEITAMVTEYTEDEAAAANPDGQALILIREDARAGSLTTTDGDNVAARGNNSGEMYVIDTDAVTLLTTIDADTATLAGTVVGSEVQVDIVDELPTGTNEIGSVVPSGSATVGTGLSTLFDSDGDNTAQAGKVSAGRLYFLEVSNPNATDAYIQLFDIATGGVTVGTTPPKLSLLVPAGDGTKDGAMDKVFNIPIHFGTAITYACTTGVTDATDPTIGLIVNLGFV